MRRDIDPPPRGLLKDEEEYFFPEAGRELPTAVPPLEDRLDELVRLDPEDSTNGEVIFDVSPPIGELIRWESEGEIVVLDHVSGATARLPATLGGSYGA